MTCESCENKSKKVNKDFTRAVIEINNPEEQIVLLRKVVIPTSMGTEEQVPAAVGKYRNVVLKYEANNHVYIYSSDGIPTLLESDVPQEVWDSIEELQQEIDDIKNNPDVVDIVGTYADLQAYDTSDLGDKDIIRVLTDETHDNESSYYRWSTATQTWTFIGATGPYYTKDEVDDLIDEGIESIDSSARVLSADDYNWPEDNPDGVALWKLPYGAYRTPSDGGVKYYISDNDPGNSYRFFMVYPNMSSGQGSATIFLAGFISGGLNYNKGKIVNVLATGYKTSEGYIITSDAVIDNLTTFALGGQAALSAKQGYVLNTRIGDLSSLETTNKSNAVAAINEVKSSIGEAKVLSSADYNWNSQTRTAVEPFDCIALWLLDSGVYSIPYGVTAYAYINLQNLQSFSNGLIIISSDETYNSQDVVSMISLNYSNTYPGHTSGQTFTPYMYSVNKTNGEGKYVILLNDSSVQNNLVSDGTSVPLAAYQGKVLNGRIGDLSTLQTTAKTSAVAAINEIVSGGGGGVATINSTDWSALWQ